LVVAVLAVAAGLGAGSSRATSRTAGQVVYGSYSSKALAGTIHFAVYLPAGYKGPTTRYPVIYLLHGLPGTDTSYRSIGFITRPIERSGMAAIVVGEQGARKGDTDPEWHDWGPGRDWETATAKELVSVIDGRYRTIGTRAGRALIGISAGGYGATLIAIHHPHVYSLIEAWSGYFHATNPEGTAPMDMGSKAADDWANAHTLVPKLKTIFNGFPWPKTHYGFYVGSNDPHFVAEDKQFDRELTDAHIHHYFAEYQGAHTESFWKQHEYQWVTAALKLLPKPQ
jgi:enterochelin esterase-like enzyme